MLAGLRAGMLVVTAGGEYKPTPTQWLLNVDQRRWYLAVSIQP